MSTTRAGKRWFRLATALTVLCLLACDGREDPTDPGDGPDPQPGDGPRLVESLLVTPDTDSIHDDAPDWSPDGRRIAYAARPISSVWTTTLDTVSPPVIVTSRLVADWLGGAHTPGYLADGRLAYYMGWSDTERMMRVMAADTSQVDDDPAPEILRRFTGSAVGLSDLQASTPRSLSLSGDGLRAVGLWRTVYTLDWTDAEDATRPTSRSPEILNDAETPRLSRDGGRIAFTTADGDVAWMAFDADDAEIVGQGRSPSWRGDGGALGYVSATGTAYRVYDFATGGTTSYHVAGAQLEQAVLSWDGRRVAFLKTVEDRRVLGYGVLTAGDAGGAAP